MPELIVRRDKGWADKLRKYRVLIDGVEVGQLAEGDELRLTIDDGPHVVQAKIDWCGSPPLEFNASTDTQTIMIRSALRGWRIMLSLAYVALWRQGYLRVELE